MSKPWPEAILLFLFSVWPSNAEARPYLRFPDLHGDRVAFVCRGDVWTARLDGDVAVRLTETPGREYFPKFSPDGRWLAFTAEVTGSPQVWVMPSAGGEPRQLTYYPSRDGFYHDDSFPSKTGFEHQVVGWSADGQKVIFRSARKDVGWWSARFFSVPRTGGLPSPLPLSEGGSLSREPGGARIAFTRSTQEFNLSESWNGYRGGMAPDIWLFDREIETLRRRTDWPGTDHHPAWTESGLYFLSDREGTMNLFRWPDGAPAPRQVTHESTWDLRWASTDGNSIVLQRGGDLVHFDPETERARVLELNVPCAPAARPRDAREHAQSLSVTEDGRVVLAARGEIFLIEKNQVRGLGLSSAGRARDVAWSPSGSRLAWISDAGGPEALWVSDAEGHDRRQLTRQDLGPLRRPVWSADDRHIAFHDYRGRLWVVDVANARSWTVASSSIRRIENYVWWPGNGVPGDGVSEDGVLIWQANLDSDRSALYAADITSGRVLALSDARFSDAHPVVTPEGDIFFLSKRRFEPRIGWIEYDYTLHDLDGLYRIDRRSFSAALQREPRTEKTAPLAAFARRLPLEHGSLSGLTTAGRLVLYRRGPELSGRAPGRYAWSLDGEEETPFAETAALLAASPSGRTVATIENGELRLREPHRVDGNDTTPTASLSLELLRSAGDPRVEWRQIVRESWRWQRALHYFTEAPIDWDGLLAKHLPLIDRATDRDDVNDILGGLIAELGIGHLTARGGDLDRNEIEETGGVLGLELLPTGEGRIRVGAVYGRSPVVIDGVRSPWARAESRVEAGDELVAIDGEPLAASVNPYEILAGRVGDSVELTFARGTAIEDRWTETIELLPSEAPLRYADWIERNRSRVLDATNGQAGYVHIPNFSRHGLTIFAQQYYSERHRPGLIIDVRLADGGYLAEAVLERLTRASWGYNDCRSCGRWTYPAAAFDGRLVLLADRYSSSDGDLFAYFFKQQGLGPVIGTRTWGGVIGGHSLELVDGGFVSSADNAVTNLEGVPEAENRGVSPDIEVVRLPHDFARGVDRQLSTAIREIRNLMALDQEKDPR